MVAGTTIVPVDITEITNTEDITAITDMEVTVIEDMEATVMEDMEATVLDTDTTITVRIMVDRITHTAQATTEITGTVISSAVDPSAVTSTMVTTTTTNRITGHVHHFI